MTADATLYQENDGMTRHTEEACRRVEHFAEQGFRQTVRDRGRPSGATMQRKGGTTTNERAFASVRLIAAWACAMKMGRNLG